MNYKEPEGWYVPMSEDNPTIDARETVRRNIDRVVKEEVRYLLHLGNAIMRIDDREAARERILDRLGRKLVTCLVDRDLIGKPSDGVSLSRHRFMLNEASRMMNEVHSDSPEAE